MRMLLIGALFIFVCETAGAASPISAPGTYPPGDYYLANDITITSGFALNFPSYTIYDSHTLNLNGKTIRCVTSGNDETFGILGSGPANMVISGGGASWIDGCRVGVSSSRYTRVQEVIFTNIKYMAMNLSGPMSRVILNVVESVGGVTDEAYSVGANINGDGAIVRGNLFHNFYRQTGAPGTLIGEGVPIILGASVTNSVVEMNYIINDLYQPDTLGVFASGSGHLIRFNTLRNFDRGVQLGGAGSILSNTLIMSPEITATAMSFTELAFVQANIVVGYLP